jgi:hypothetical protein
MDAGAMTLRKGQWFRTVVEVRARCIVHLSPPLTKEHTAILGSGEVFVIIFVPPFESPAVICRPYRYGALESQFIDHATREDPSYRGYVLGIDVAVIERDCEPTVPIDDRPS